MQPNKSRFTKMLVFAFLGVSLAMSAAFSAVERTDTKTTPPKQSVSAGEKSEFELEVEGMITVRFYATVQPVTRGLRQTFDQIDNNISNLERYIPEAAKYRGGYSNWYPLRLDDDDVKPLRIPNFFNKDDTAALRAAHSQFGKDYTELFRLCNTMIDYLKDPAASKDDNFKKYTDAKPRILELVEKVRAEAAELDSRALKLATAGEARTLPKNPSGIFIINMRTMIDEMEKFGPLINNPAFKERDRYEDARNKRAPETDEEKAARMALAAETAAKIDAVVAQVTELAKTHKAVSTDVIAYENKSATETCVRSVTDFYGYNSEDILKSLAHICADLRAKGTVRRSDADSVKSHLHNLYSSHNRYVEMFNLWAGGTQAIKLIKNY